MSHSTPITNHGDTENTEYVKVSVTSVPPWFVWLRAQV